MKTNKGFSLVELIVVLAIMAILIGVSVPLLTSYIEKSQISTDQPTVQDVADALKLANNSGTYSFVVENQYSEGLSKPVGFVIVSKDELGDGEYVKTVMFAEGAEDVLDKALAAKFGEDYASSIQLEYDGWNGSLGSFFANASTMVTEVETMAEDAHTANSLLKNVGIPLFAGSYDDADDLFHSLAGAIKGKFNTSGDFAEVWCGVNRVDYDFSFVGYREYYSAIREAYNIFFANYVSAAGSSYTADGKTHTDCATHVGLIKDYGEDAIELGTAYIEANFNKYLQGAAKDALETAFKNSDLYLPKTAYTTVFADGGEIACRCCAALYEEYKNSTQAKSDAINFYNTMVTASTYDSATNSANIFDWMKNEAVLLAGQYDSVNSMINGKSAIVLAVYYKDGQLTIEVAPMDAQA